MTRRQKRSRAKKGLNRKLLYSVFLVTMVLLVTVIVYSTYFMTDIGNWTAAIVDQLAIEGEPYINIEFNTTITSLFGASGFGIKYYPGEEVDINFYKDLPSRSGKIIVVRAHSAVRSDTDFIDLFTSESYDPQKEEEYSSYGTQISIANFLRTDSKYFAVGPTFVDLSMKGRFDNDCVIILMGCNSLNETTLAEALIRRGAKVVIGWIGWVEIRDTDNSTKQLLQYLLDENPYPIYGAVDEINEQSHKTNVKLDYYPKDEKTKHFTLPKRETAPTTHISGQLGQAASLIFNPKIALSQGNCLMRPRKMAYSSS